MHELGITQNIIAIARAYAGSARVQRVVLEIGNLAAIMPAAILFCFDICAQGTPLEGAILEIREIPGLARCRTCGQEMALSQLFGICSCGSHDLQVIQGEELKIKELELEEVCV